MLLVKFTPYVAKVAHVVKDMHQSSTLVFRYLLLTFVLNVITILVTVIIINIYFRCPATYKMPPWVRTLFLEVGALIWDFLNQHSITLTIAVDAVRNVHATAQIRISEVGR